MSALGRGGERESGSERVVKESLGSRSMEGRRRLLLMAGKKQTGTEKARGVLKSTMHGYLHLSKLLPYSLLSRDSQRLTSIPSLELHHTTPSLS